MRNLWNKLLCLVLGHRGEWQTYTTRVLDEIVVLPYLQSTLCKRCDEFCLRFNKKSPEYLK